MTAGYSCARFHPDGMILGTGTKDSLVRIWELRNLQNVATFEGHASPIKTISFSENGAWQGCRVQGPGSRV